MYYRYINTATQYSSQNQVNALKIKHDLLIFNKNDHLCFFFCCIAINKCLVFHDEPATLLCS